MLLLGPSGAGKSTLLAALAGLHEPETAGEPEGSLVVDGRPARELRSRTGLLLQDPDTQLVMARAGDDVAFGLENAGLPEHLIWPRVDEALAAVGFGYGRQRSTAALSGGEKQRLALAGVLARRPGLLLLDEPTANLDPAGADLVRQALARVDATVLLVEHRVAEALPLIDRVVVLAAGGGVAADGSPDEVLRRHADELAAAGIWVPGRPIPTRHATTSPGQQVLAGDDLSYRHIRPPDVSLHRGEAVALTGANGTGKTTTAMLLAGLRRPDSGGAFVPGNDKPLHRWRAHDLARTVGTVFQEPEHQFLRSTVADELGGTHGDLLERLHLTRYAAANPFTLSGGEKRRLSVATALASGADVLVLDEPTFGQDARTWAELLALLADLRDEGAAVLAVTHDEAFASALADRRLVLT
ncbi:MAG: transporter ATP-binding protein [Frankiales bacterium]|nr:transporter ATP-binding protein [Frankiales bacterium]